MDDHQPELARELMAVTYTRLVQHLARQAFDTGRTADFLHLIDEVCARCGIELLSPDLVERMADCFGDPFDQFLLRVEVRSSALWEIGGWRELLSTLRQRLDNASTTPAGPAPHAHWPAPQPSRRRTRANRHTVSNQRAAPPAR